MLPTMGATSTGNAVPLEHLLEGADHSVCPECEHERQQPRSRFAVWIAQRLGMRVPTAYCTYWQSSDESGLGFPGECSCRHAFHGS